jgi:hypothetical protein
MEFVKKFLLSMGHRVKRDGRDVRSSETRKREISLRPCRAYGPEGGQKSEVRRQRQKIDLNGFNDFNVINDLNDLNDLKNWLQFF